MTKRLHQGHDIGFFNPNSSIGGIISLPLEINGEQYHFRFISLSPEQSGIKPGQGVPLKPHPHIHPEVYKKDKDGKWCLTNYNPLDFLENAKTQQKNEVQ
jgi:hypothetical protein